MFCLAGPDMPDINDQVERRHNRLNELTATVGSVFLGLQLGCAQCHDHKYDPLSQGDFYRLRAVFESSVPPLKRDVPYYKLTEQKAVEPARFWIRGDHRRPGIEVQAGFPRIATPPAGSDSDELQDESEAVVLRPQFRSRTELANWLMRDDNPLTSRVIVNRLWQHHFGRGIVTTPGDFGLLGAAPTHPELLDWLAVELREQGWSQKHLHRMIVNSATYRQRSQLPQVDPPAGNATVIDECYARFPRRRLDGEAIRDSLLFAAGLLTAERGGPGVMPPLPEELIGTLLKGQWKTSERETDHYRRSIYVFARRNLRYPLFEAFDRPDGNASCALRSRSTTAPQSLLLLNSELSLLAARHLAERLVEHSPESAEQVDALFRLTLARSINSGEQRQLLDFLAGQRERLIADARPDDLAKNGLPTARKNPVDSHAMAALVDLCLAVLNSSEFLYID